MASEKALKLASKIFYESVLWEKRDISEGHAAELIDAHTAKALKDAMAVVDELCVALRFANNENLHGEAGAKAVNALARADELKRKIG